MHRFSQIFGTEICFIGEVSTTFLTCSYSFVNHRQTQIVNSFLGAISTLSTPLGTRLETWADAILMFSLHRMSANYPNTAAIMAPCGLEMNIFSLMTAKETYFRSIANTLASQVGSYYAASVTCNDTRFPLPGPQFYTCDVMASLIGHFFDFRPNLLSQSTPYLSFYLNSTLYFLSGLKSNNFQSLFCRS